MKKQVALFVTAAAILAVALLYVPQHWHESPLAWSLAMFFAALFVAVLPLTRGDAAKGTPWSDWMARFYTWLLLVGFPVLILGISRRNSWMEWAGGLLTAGSVIYLLLRRQARRAADEQLFTWHWRDVGKWLVVLLELAILEFELMIVWTAIVTPQVAGIDPAIYRAILDNRGIVLPREAVQPQPINTVPYTGQIVDMRAEVEKQYPGAKVRLKEGEQPEASYANGIVLHHTAGRCSNDEPWTAALTSDVTQKGWDHVPYNIMIKQDGTVMLMTDYGITAYSVGGDNNPLYFSISVIGYFHQPCNQVPNDAQLAGVVKAMRWALAKGVPAKVIGHRDLNPGTACPGDNLYPMVQDLFKLAQRDDLAEDMALITAVQQLQFEYGKKLGWKEVPRVATVPSNVTRVTATSGTRAVWVDAYNSPPNSAQMATDLVAWAKKNGVTLLVVQVRTRNTACYFKGCSNMTFDGLGAVLSAAKPAGIKVHAWYDGGWMSSDSSPDYTNAAEQARILADVKALVDNYPDLNGVHLDRIRYSDGAGASQTQRDALTELVGKIHQLTSAAGKQLSAAVVTWSPSPAKGGFKGTRPYTEVGQDFESWATKKYIDMLMPMNYFESLDDYKAWVDYEAQLKQSSGVPFLSGLPDYFLNAGRNVDLRAMEKYAADKAASGVIYYSYASMVSGNRTLGPSLQQQEAPATPIQIPTPQGGWPQPTPTIVPGILEQLVRGLLSAPRGTPQAPSLALPVGTTNFSSANAFQTVKYLAGTIGVRKCGSAKELEAMNWLKAQLESYGYQTSLVTFKYSEVKPYIPPGATQAMAEQNYQAMAQDWPNGGSVALIASPKNPEYLFGAHVDSLSVFNADEGGQIDSPGAVDNGSGVAVTLEAARVLKGQNIGFAFFGCEEAGLFGSEYVAAKGLVKPIKGMISVDMVGTGEQSNTYILFTGASADKALADTMTAAGKSLGRQVQLEEGSSIGGSDDISFRNHQIPAANLGWAAKASEGGQTVWFLAGADSSWMHRPSDTPDKVSPAALQGIGDWVVKISGGRTTAPAIQFPGQPQKGLLQQAIEWLSQPWGSGFGQVPLPGSQQPPAVQPTPEPAAVNITVDGAVPPGYKLNLATMKQALVETCGMPESKPGEIYFRAIADRSIGAEACVIGYCTAINLRPKNPEAWTVVFDQNKVTRAPDPFNFIARDELSHWCAAFRNEPFNQNESGWTRAMRDLEKYEFVSQGAPTATPASTRPAQPAAPQPQQPVQPQRPAATPRRVNPTPMPISPPAQPTKPAPQPTAMPVQPTTPPVIQPTAQPTPASVSVCPAGSQPAPRFSLEGLNFQGTYTLESLKGKRALFVLHPFG